MKKAKIVYENKSLVSNSDNYRWVYLSGKIKYGDLSTEKCCYNCVHCGQKDHFIFCCKYLDEICMCSSGVCDSWKSPKYSRLYVGPVKRKILKSLGIELVNTKQR
ncbi:MAG: hypothetical protein IKP05_01540 [Alphaproteobacteria bacterium]|nr:hypothetical protein [Alphaproteobacteria bacterium]